VYKPSEMGELMRRIINDSLLIFWLWMAPCLMYWNPFHKQVMADGPFAAKIILYGWKGFIRPEMLNIYIIDPVNQIAVWEYKSNTEKEYRYELCIPEREALILI
jgi:hypothetical protein